jgi:predicted acetyltransferase
MDIVVSVAEVADKPVLRNLYQLYEYEFSRFDPTDVNEHGLFDSPRYFDHYWTEAGRYPFLIRVDGKLAGFAFVQEYSYVGAGEGTHCIAEFFVMPKYRRQGVGEFVASELFGRFPGRWEVAEMEANVEAQQFWRKVIGRFTGDNYEETAGDGNTWTGRIQVFLSPVTAPEARTQ